MSKIILSGTLEAISTRHDKTFKIVFGTQEINKSSVSDLFEMVNNYCKVLISSTNITEPEAILIDEAKVKDGRKIKTHSQRLRAVLFRYHEQTAPDTDFEQFYNEKMEGLIEHYKQKLQ